MPRKRKKEDGLPLRCERLPSGSVRYKPKDAPGVIIADKHMTLPQIRQAYNDYIMSHTPTELRYFADRFYDSNAFESLSERSKADYRECEKKPIEYFKGSPAHLLGPEQINGYLKKRWKKAKRRTNLELLWFRRVYDNAISEGLYRRRNPTDSIKPFRLSREERKAQKAKRRHVSDEDYKAMQDVLEAAIAKKHWGALSTWVAMEISFCTGCRQGDVLSMRWEDLRNSGSSIYVEENKTDNEYLKNVSPRLRKALERALKLRGHPFQGFVIHNTQGGQFTSKGFQSNWKRYKAKLPKHQQFTFHEIRHKAITEAEEDKKQLFSMHKDARMIGTYNHELAESPSH